jgi:hypothetical protein
VFPCIPQCRVQSGNVVTTSHRLLLWIPGPVSFFLLSLKIRAPQPSAFRPTALLQIAFDSVGYCSDGYISSCDRQAGGPLRSQCHCLHSSWAHKPSLTFSTDLCDNYGCPSDHFQLYAACRTATAPSPHVTTNLVVKSDGRRDISLIQTKCVGATKCLNVLPLHINLSLAQHLVPRPICCTLALLQVLPPSET